MEALVLKFEALGDVLRTTALLEGLAARGRVTWITSPAALPLIERHPGLSRALALRLDDAAGAARLSRRLAGRFDLVLSLEEHPAAAALAAAACRGELVGVRDEGGRLGYTPSSAAYYDMSLLNRGADGGLEAADALRAANTRSYSRLWHDVLGLRAAGGAALPSLHLSPRDRAEARRLAPGLRRPVIGLNAGAGARWPAKQLSEEKAASLALALARSCGGSVLLLGGKEAGEAARNRRIAALAAREDRALRPVIPPRLPVRSFAAMIELCDALVTTDSLALHIAAALRRPALALVGPTSAAELDFHGAGRAVRPPRGCECFYAARCGRARHCLDEIPDDELAASVRALLAPARPAAPDARRAYSRSSSR